MTETSSRSPHLQVGVVHVRHGLFAWETQLLLGVTAVTSFFATNRGTSLASRLLPNDNSRTPWAVIRSRLHRKDSTS